MFQIVRISTISKSYILSRTPSNPRKIVNFIKEFKILKNTKESSVLPKKENQAN
jgi:hypothetical protein